jgi:hypothetical protein
VTHEPSHSTARRHVDHDFSRIMLEAVRNGQSFVNMYRHFSCSDTRYSARSSGRRAVIRHSRQLMHPYCSISQPLESRTVPSRAVFNCARAGADRDELATGRASAAADDLA